MMKINFKICFHLRGILVHLTKGSPVKPLGHEHKGL